MLTLSLTLLCVCSLGLRGGIAPYPIGPASMHFGSGHIGKGDLWKFGVFCFAGLLLIVLPWLQMIGRR